MSLRFGQIEGYSVGCKVYGFPGVNYTFAYAQNCKQIDVLVSGMVHAPCCPDAADII